MTVRVAAWPARDADRDKLLAWTAAARQFAGELHPQTCHNCMIGRLDLLARAGQPPEVMT